MGSSNPMPTAPQNPYTGLGQANTGAMSGMDQIANGTNYAANTYNQYGGGLAGSLAATNYNPQDNVSGGQYMMGQAPNMYAQGNQLMNMGLDPQQNYYNQAFQQNQQQTRAGLEARGIDSSPAGAAAETQSNQYFNNLWQNQQAARAAQLTGAANQMYGQGAGQMLGGAGLGASTVGQQYGQLAQLQQAGLASYAQTQQGTQDYLSYLNQGGNYQMQQYQAQLQAQAQQNAQQSSSMAGMGQMAGMAAMMMMSDRRLKENITKFSELSDGTPVYSFKYKNEDGYHIGVMAQDILETHPEAVHEVDGFYAVDYSKLAGLL
jgi:Chaperone of endosialidase